MFEKFKQWLLSLFFRKRLEIDEAKNGLKKFDIYAVVTGTYVGEMWIYIETIDDVHKFISIPKLINREAPIEKVELGLKEGIMEVVEPLKNDCRELIYQQYLYNNRPKLKDFEEMSD